MEPINLEQQQKSLRITQNVLKEIGIGIEQADQLRFYPDNFLEALDGVILMIEMRAIDNDRKMQVIRYKLDKAKGST